MMLKISTINQFLIIVALLNYVSSVDIECDFSHDDFDTLYNTYACAVDNELVITSKNTAIESIVGQHLYSRSIDGVAGFSARNKIINYFPTKLEERFTKLIAIRIRNCQLKEIHQNDLKPFTKLQYLNLDLNSIEILEDGLFNYNPSLEVIWFESNKIKAIGQTAFDSTKALRDLDLSGNICASRRVSSRFGMDNFITSLKTACASAYTTTLEPTTTEEVTTELYKIKDIMLKADELVPETRISPLAWIIIAVLIICGAAAAIIFVIMRNKRNRVVVVRPIEPEDY